MGCFFLEDIVSCMDLRLVANNIESLYYSSSLAEVASSCQTEVDCI